MSLRCPFLEGGSRFRKYCGHISRHKESSGANNIGKCLKVGIKELTAFRWLSGKLPLANVKDGSIQRLDF